MIKRTKVDLLSEIEKLEKLRDYLANNKKLETVSLSEDELKMITKACELVRRGDGALSCIKKSSAIVE